jgi:hypothetical protein
MFDTFRPSSLFYALAVGLAVMQFALLAGAAAGPGAEALCIAFALTAATTLLREMVRHGAGRG